MQGIRDIQAIDLTAELERVAMPLLVKHLQARGAGHCMRVGDLDTDLMVRLCRRLRAEVPSATIVVLADGNPGIPAEVAVSSSKLVELRNPLPNGDLRPGLLAFVPADVRASAEDSFGIATFEEVHLAGLYGALREHLLLDLPPAVRGALVEGLRRLQECDRPWPFADELSVVRFLLTAKVNGNDPEAIGAALYEIGLVPDFELLAKPEKVPQRLARNRDSVAALTWSSRSDRGRVMELGLAKRAFRNQLGDFLADTGAEDPRAWTRRIVLDRNCWSLAFNRWEFEDGGEEPEALFIGDVTTDLPVLEEQAAGERLAQLIGQKVLPTGKGGLRKFGVAFRVAPAPSKLPGLAKFVAQVVSKERGPIGFARSKTPWRTANDRATITFSSLGRVDWEPGWHFVRIIAATVNGDIVPLTDESGEAIPWGRGDETPGSRPNESDLFYVLPEGDIDVEPAQRAVPREQSATHALLRARFGAVLGGRKPEDVSLTGVAWAEKRPHGRGAATDLLEVRLGREGTVHVPVSRVLKTLEQKILAAPDGPITWRLPVSMGVPDQSTGDLSGWPTGATADQFLATRRRYFEVVRRGGEELVTQASDAAALRETAAKYAAAYLALLGDLARRVGVSSRSDSMRASADLRRVLALDSVLLVLADHRGRRRAATLVAPTHPLRALWFATWGQLGATWVASSAKGASEYAVPTRDTLLRLLAPTSFPPVLPTGSGHVLTAVDSLTPFWTLYAPGGEEDPRGLIGDVCAALGLPEPAIGGALIDGRYLASRIRRYLVQHPYVRTLAINAFNAGRASSLADTLLELQKDPAIADLRYDIRLFVPDPEAPGVGEALAALLSPEASVAAREAEAFSAPSESHLRPKLALAVRSVADFRVAPALYAAHLSILFDLFPAAEVGAQRANRREETAFVHGLVQDFRAEYHEDQLTVAWRRSPHHGHARPIEGAEDLSDLLSALSASMSSATACVATGQSGVELRPVMTLALGPEERALLHQLHEASDWVFTLDRNLGIEFFDHGGLKSRPEYLIDHSPDWAGSLGHRLVITSRSVTELEALLRPVLGEHGLSADGRPAVLLLSQLRSLSGRLALKLIASPTQRLEALGLALSRLYIEHQGAFEDQIVVPLDTHMELYHVLRAQADELGDDVSLKRTDLALFDLDLARREIVCRLVEVKCYTTVGDLATYGALKKAIAEQIAQSEQVLAHHFDPHRTPVDRPDRAMKTHEFATMLEFYLARAERYGIVAAPVAQEARTFIRTLDDGYHLYFTRSALVFDFDKPGTEPPDSEEGIEYHRVGVDLVRQLIEAAAPETSNSADSSPASDEGGPTQVPPGLIEVRRRRERAPSVPTLGTAAFLAGPRDRSATGESSDTPRGSEPASPRSETDDGSATQPAADGPPPSAPSSPQPVIEPAAAVPHLDYDVMLGATSASPQYGLLGDVSGRRVALDLNQTHTISLFGVQGGGKSYTLGTIAEMASLPILGVNELPRPLATVIFHYSPTMDYKPEFISMVSPNTEVAQVRQLRELYGAEPASLEDVLLLVPAGKLEERVAEFPNVRVHPLRFAAAELQTSHWRFLLGAVGNQATYIRQLNRVMKGLRDQLTLAGIRAGVSASSLPDHLKEMAKVRLDLAAEYVDDHAHLGTLVRPGRLIIVDLRDEFIEKDEALGLFVVLLQVFADATHGGRLFNKLVVFDEAHKYIENPDLVSGMIEVVREMRHKGTSVLVASQDPPSVPVALIELSSQIILHRFNSPAWLKHIQKANAALGVLTPEKMASLRPGEAYVWSSKATDNAFSTGAVRVRCRPRVTRHGGATKVAVDDGH